ncbi:MAG: PEP-CTERM sorting domain-containing protein [bacterium]|nr:PEP-CTERM sorting domain-containing protein [bacterium]
MKKWLTLSLALVAAAVTQAVTVAWTVPNSDYNVESWAYTADESGNLTLGFNIYFVYSAEALGETAEAAAKAAYDKVVAETKTNVYDGYVMDPTTEGLSDGRVAAYANGLPPNPDTQTNLVDGSGYYYMVVVNNKDGKSGEYAVAGTNSEVTVKTGSDAVDGVYVSNVAGSIQVEDYFDFDGWLGGTWTNAMTPEPTVLALLAFGVAGVALRRKKNFTK